MKKTCTVVRILQTRLQSETDLSELLAHRINALIVYIHTQTTSVLVVYRFHTVFNDF